jgi:hypothetical protein
MIPGEVDIDAALSYHGTSVVFMSGMQHRKECHTRTTVMKALSWMSAHIAGDPANSLCRRDGRGSGRRERLNVPRDVQHQMNCDSV